MKKKHLLDNVSTLACNPIKMVDSGIFSKNGCTIGYEGLFERYNTVGTDFGVMIDVLGEEKAALKSGEKALKIYEKNKKEYRFWFGSSGSGKNFRRISRMLSKIIFQF